MALNTMRTAYLKWRSLESRREATRQDLNHHYLALFHKVEALNLDTHLGLLHLAPIWLAQPLEPQTLHLQQRLKHAFAVLGKYFYRRAPNSLQLDIRRYADHIEKICRQCHLLSARLNLCQKVFEARRQSASLINEQSCRLALYNPEAVWIALLLRQRRQLTRQAIDLSLARSWQTKLMVCQKWLELLQPSLSPQSWRDLQRSLAELENQTAGQPGQEWFPSLAAQKQLDLLISLANQHAAGIISSQPGLK